VPRAFSRESFPRFLAGEFFFASADPPRIFRQWGGKRAGVIDFWRERRSLAEQRRRRSVEGALFEAALCFYDARCDGGLRIPVLNVGFRRGPRLVGEGF